MRNNITRVLWVSLRKKQSHDVLQRQTQLKVQNCRLTVGPVAKDEQHAESSFEYTLAPRSKYQSEIAAPHYVCCEIPCKRSSASKICASLGVERQRKSGCPLPLKRDARRTKKDKDTIERGRCKTSVTDSELRHTFFLSFPALEFFKCSLLKPTSCLRNISLFPCSISHHVVLYIVTLVRAILQSILQRHRLIASSSWSSILLSWLFRQIRKLAIKSLGPLGILPYSVQIVSLPTLLCRTSRMTST